MSTFVYLLSKRNITFYIASVSLSLCWLNYQNALWSEHFCDMIWPAVLILSGAIYFKVEWAVNILNEIMCFKVAVAALRHIRVMKWKLT